jgi:anti-sigma factor (TIGR02949 family)
MTVPDCAKCEQLLQPYVDRALDVEERTWVRSHLDGCPFCAKCYRLEDELRKRIRTCCEEQVAEELASADLKERLSSLRQPLD